MGLDLTALASGSGMEKARSRRAEDKNAAWRSFFAAPSQAHQQKNFF
jgi:hypothetical protein